MAGEKFVGDRIIYIFFHNGKTDLRKKSLNLTGMKQLACTNTHTHTHTHTHTQTHTHSGTKTQMLSTEKETEMSGVSS